MRRGLLALVVMASFVVGAGAAQATKIVVLINKVNQKMTVSVDGAEEYSWPISTGAPGYDTPSGTFHPYRMEVTHFSQEWDNSPMPHSIFFIPDGHAIHGSYHVKYLGRRASHGCVRLAPDNASILYAMVQKAGMRNTTVIIKGGIFDGGFYSFDAPGVPGAKRKPFWFFQHD
jgi:lipoprotein-anchoring transpeptidase ErfK/SrfK